MANIPWERAARKHILKMQRQMRADYGVSHMLSTRRCMVAARERVAKTGSFLASSGVPLVASLDTPPHLP